MKKLRFIHYQESSCWVGWFEEHPDYRTQGKSLQQLKSNMKDSYNDLKSIQIPQDCKIGELTAESDPVLAELWNNEKDAAYDRE